MYLPEHLEQLLHLIVAQHAAEAARQARDCRSLLGPMHPHTEQAMREMENAQQLMLAVCPRTETTQ